MNQKLKQKIDNKKIVSFDIFDTALIRNIHKPNELFSFIEKYINQESYSEKRKQLEIITSSKINKKYPNINEMYGCYYDKSIKDIEIDFEKKILTANKEILEIYNYCIKNNKKVIFTSDMYLTSNILSNILIENGYTYYYKIFVSCEYDAIKGDGSLFDVIIKELNCKPSDILHIGDSLKGDYLNAKKKGIDAFLYKRNKLKKEYGSLEDNIYNEFIFNKNVSGTEGYKYGYNKLGILLYSFSNWLNNQLEKEGINNVFFLSRDGYIMKEIFDKVKNEDIKTKYLYVSRRSLTVPNLWNNLSYDDLANNITMTNFFTIDSFIKRLGLNPNEYSKLKKEANIDDKEEFSGKKYKSDKKLRNFYELIKEDVYNNSKREQELLIKYLKMNNFSGKVAIVDIGWHGTMQKNIEKTCQIANIDIDLKGFYLGQEKIIKKGQGFLFNESDNLKNKIALAGSFGLFESFFLAHHGSVTKYKEVNNKIEPVLAEYEFKDNPEDLIIIDEIQRGAIDFCNDFSKNIYLKCLNYDNKFFSPIFELLTNPNYHDTKYLSNVIFNDTINSKLIENKRIIYYCFHLNTFKKDFLKCTWKMGFIKKVFKVKLPYFKLYYLLKSKEGGKND